MNRYIMIWYCWLYLFEMYVLSIVDLFVFYSQMDLNTMYNNFLLDCKYWWYMSENWMWHIFLKSMNCKYQYFASAPHSHQSVRFYINEINLIWQKWWRKILNWIKKCYEGHVISNSIISNISFALHMIMLAILNLF